MSALLTKAFEKWVAECTASNLPARPDAIIFAMVEREPTREDDSIPAEKITYAVNELTYGQLAPNSIVCSAVVPDDCEFSYDWICLTHQASGTLCGVIKTPVRQKLVGESLIRNFTLTYSGMAQAAQITVPPQSWQVDVYPELKAMLKTSNRLSEIAAAGVEAQQESRENLGLTDAATMEVQSSLYDRSHGRLALPGAFGYGMAAPDGNILTVSEPDELGTLCFDYSPGRYYCYSPKTTGVAEFIWLNNSQGDKTSETVTKLVVFYGTCGRILATFRGSDRTAPVKWINLGAGGGSDGSGGTSEPSLKLQHDMYDRTPERAAIPGTLGFGAFYPDAVVFSNYGGPAELGRWVQKTPPGRYAVAQKVTDTSYVPILPGVEFRGEIEIKIPDVTTEAEHTEKEKLLIFYSVNGDAYFTRYKPGVFGELTGWENMRLQTVKNIYDRTSGRAALPGALGFGALYSEVQRFSSAGGITSFKVWVTRTGPGRYFVSQDIGDQYDPIIDGEVFTGEVEIKILDKATVSDQKEKDKVVIFYGQQGCVYYNRLIYNGLSSKFTGWENLKNSPKDFVALQQSVSSDPHSSPKVGGLTWAAVMTGANTDVSVHRGKVFQGSQLVNMAGFIVSPSTSEQTSKSASFIVNPADTHALSGSYAALSGVPTVTYSASRAVLGLFIRIA